jgi:molybdate transport system substrate-binding protein
LSSILRVFVEDQQSLSALQAIHLAIAYRPALLSDEPLKVIMHYRIAGCFIALVLLASSALADTLRITGAGSLTEVFTDLIRRFPAGADTIAAPEFGPSGLMREKIEAGLDADLFASADMEQARRLAAGHPERSVIHFTRNRLCAIARTAVGLTTQNMLDRLLDPAVRLATSTPGADPGGDYAWAVFARAEAIRAGARNALQAKAQQLYGGGAKTPLLIPDKGPIEGIFLSNRADVALAYCSGAAAVTREIPDLAVVPLPAELTVGPAYGMVLINPKPVTLRFAAFVMSEGGQAVLKAHGFDPVALAEPVPPSSGLLVQRTGQASHVIPVDRIGALKPITQTVTFTTEHGERQAEWTGPSLWDVLGASGLLESVNVSEQPRLVVRVTGSDGYTAVVALAEIAPQFAGRPVQLAYQMNGTPLPNNALRLVVPGDRRGGRSVRDVIRVDID